MKKLFYFLSLPFWASGTWFSAHLCNWTTTAGPMNLDFTNIFALICFVLLLIAFLFTIKCGFPDRLKGLTFLGSGLLLIALCTFVYFQSKNEIIEYYGQGENSPDMISPTFSFLPIFIFGPVLVLYGLEKLTQD